METVDMGLGRPDASVGESDAVDVLLATQHGRPRAARARAPRDRGHVD
jgi:hypothetical protein